MVEIHRSGPGKWQNYHETIEIWAHDRFDLVGGIATSNAAGFLSDMARAQQALLHDQLAKMQDVRPLGASWSFSEINRTDGSVCETKNSGQVFAVAPDQMSAASQLDPALLVLASAGTTIANLNLWLEHHELSLNTSGASNGQTIAGAAATGTHGSVPGFGGFQNHIRGIHIIVSPSESVWIESPDRPALSDAFAASFATRVIRDASLFEAASVHLGGLGIVNAVLLEVAPKFMCEVIQSKAVIDQSWIDDLQRGDFRSVAKRLGHDEDPYLLQIIIDPFSPFKAEALLRIFFKRPAPLAVPFSFLNLGHVIDPLSILSAIFSISPGVRKAGIAELMRLQFPTLPKDPDHPLLQTWGQTTPPHKWFGKLYSGSFAVPREHLSDALQVMLRAFNVDGGGDFVFTLRFVGACQGTLAFTRFPANVVIDTDGFRSHASLAAAGRILSALEAAKIPFSQHWGKMGTITPARVDRDFAAKVAAWKAARSELLGRDMQKIFASHGLRQWGLT